MKNIAIFASGQGTNAQNLIRFFHNHKSINISLIVTNKTTAGVLEVAKENHIESYIANKSLFETGEELISILKNRKIDLIVLAGFLLKVPKSLIQAFPIVNIHPSLLPKYGGKGMYGSKVHQAVIDAKETYSGITIHRVNEVYDKGEILFQAKVEIKKEDTADTLQAKIHQLEYQHYPIIIEKDLLSHP